MAQLKNIWQLSRWKKKSWLDYLCLLFEALFALDKGTEKSQKQGLAALRRAMEIGKKYGCAPCYIWHPDVMAHLFAKALEHGIEVEYVQGLIRKCNPAPETPPVHLENWPWEVRIYTLGRFGLLREGKPVRFSGKAQKKPLELLKALISFGGREISKVTISDALWPEAEGDMANNSFKMALQRLRRLLGSDKAVTVSEGLVTLENRYCWVDVWAFERLVGEADGKGKEREKIRIIQSVLEMYRGEFLSMDGLRPWIVSMRERLRSKFLRNVTWLGNYRQQRGNYDKAIECYQRALETDNLAEELYRRLMSCYLRLGQKAEGIAVYNRCRQNISRSLGITPSPETEKLYRSLLSGGI